MLILFSGLTISVIGKIMVALSVLKVHHVMAKEHHIDNKVIRMFTWEKEVTYVGIFLIIVGYGLEIWFYAIHNIVVTPTELL